MTLLARAVQDRRRWEVVTGAGGRQSFTSSTGTVDQLTDDRGSQTSMQLPARVRFGANGVLSLMRSLTTAPAQRGGESQIYQR